MSWDITKDNKGLGHENIPNEDREMVLQAIKEIAEIPLDQRPCNPACFTVGELDSGWYTEGPYKRRVNYPGYFAFSWTIDTGKFRQRLAELMAKQP